MAVSEVILRPLFEDETDSAARQHHAAAWFDFGLHTQEETYDFYREVFAKGLIWGAYDDGELVGHCAIEPGWINQMFVDPGRQSEGIGSLLLDKAMEEMTDVQLWTFQGNFRARRFYEYHGFVAEEFTDGAGNEEKEPDVRYRWRHKQ